MSGGVYDARIKIVWKISSWAELDGVRVLQRSSRTVISVIVARLARSSSQKEGHGMKQSFSMMSLMPGSS
jgi:hypothetical protein